MSMLGSYLLIGLRQLFAHKLYSAINIVGLAVGLACAILIFLFVQYELGFDERFKDAERIYRISADVEPGSSQLARIRPRTSRRPQRSFWPTFRTRSSKQAGFSSNSNLFDCAAARIRFTRTAFAGRTRASSTSSSSIGSRAIRKRALAEPASVVLTASAAAKYFGAENPLGETLLLENQWPLTVTGVIRDLPRDTHLAATAIARWTRLPMFSVIRSTLPIGASRLFTPTSASSRVRESRRSRAGSRISSRATSGRATA